MPVVKIKFHFDNIISSVRDQLLLEKYIATKSGEHNFICSAMYLFLFITNKIKYSCENQNYLTLYLSLATATDEGEQGPVLPYATDIINKIIAVKDTNNASAKRKPETFRLAGTVITT